MHIFPAVLIGSLTWIGTMVHANAKLYAFIAGPVIVSGVALALTLAPEISRARPWSSAATAAICLSIGGFIWSLLHL
jgi:hypothetical protein